MKKIQVKIKSMLVCPNGDETISFVFGAEEKNLVVD